MKIAVITHIYHEHLWEELKRCVENIAESGAECDFFATLRQDSKLEKELLAFNPKARIFICENRGYDVAPFLDVLNKIDLKNYDYVLKLHTKRDRHGTGVRQNNFNVEGPRWRKYLLEPFVNQKNLRKCFSAFEKNKKIGMIGSFKLTVFREKYEPCRIKTGEILAKAGLPGEKTGCVSGTIFMVRARLLEPLKKLNLSYKDFEASDEKREHSLAHDFERVFGGAVLNQGYSISDPTIPLVFQKIRLFWEIIKKFAYHKYVNQRGIQKITIARIPVYSKKAAK